MDWKAIRVVPKADFCGFMTWTKMHRAKPEWFQRQIRSFDLWVVAGGYGEVRLKDGRVFEMKRGSLFYLYPDLVEEAWQQPGRERVSMFWFHHELFRNDVELTPCDLGDLPFCHETVDIAFYETVAQKVLALMNFNLAFTLDEFQQRRAEAGILLQGLLMDFEHHARLVGEADRQLIPARHLMVRRLALKVSQNPELFRHPGDLAKKAGYNKDYLARLFREVLDESPREVILNARIQKAKRLLSLTRLPLNMSDVAEMCGYQNVFYFSNQFKQRTGYSPSEFRKRSNISGNVPGNWTEAPPQD